jgi:hypothetical protein
MEFFSFDDKPARKAKKQSKIERPAVVEQLVVIATPVVAKKREPKVVAPRKHVRQTRVKRVVKVQAGVVTVTFKRVKAGVVASVRGAASITIMPRESDDPNRAYRALIEYSATNTAVYYGATERAAYKRAASIAWN